MENRIKRTVAGLMQQTNEAIAGLVAYAAPLNLVAVPVDVLKTSLNEFTAAKNTCNRERAELSKRRQALAATLATAMEFVTLTREILKPSIGKKHSPKWAAAGFVKSMAVPRTLDEMLSLLSALGVYLAAHPEQEIAALDIVAARANTLFTDLVEANKAVNAQKTAVAEAMEARETLRKQIHRLLRLILSELSTKVGPMDSCYTTFGFNRPGQAVTPDVPTNVAAVIVGPNAMAVKWGQAPRAEYYRVWAKVVGVDAEPKPVGTPADLDFTLEDLPSAAEVEIAVSAVNNGGESGRSEIIRVNTA